MASRLLARCSRSICSPKPGAVRCFDTDQENTTFTHYEALGVRHVAVTNPSRLIDPKKFDGLMETLLTEEGNFVIDTGANTFSNFLAYMVENDVFPMLEDAGKTTYIHTIVGDGDTLADTANGFHAIAQRSTGRGWCCVPMRPDGRPDGFKLSKEGA